MLYFHRQWFKPQLPETSNGVEYTAEVMIVHASGFVMRSILYALFATHGFYLPTDLGRA